MGKIIILSMTMITVMLILIMIIYYHRHANVGVITPICTFCESYNHHNFDDNVSIIIIMLKGVISIWVW